MPSAKVLLLALVALAGSFIHPSPCEGKAAPQWLSPKKLQELTKEAGFRVAVVLYTEGKADDDVLDALDAVSRRLKNFPIQCYKIDCTVHAAVSECQSRGEEHSTIYIQHGVKRTQLTAEFLLNDAAIVANALQTLLLKFKVGNGKKMRTVSTQNKLDQLSDKDRTVIVFATQNMYGEAHANFLEAAFFFLNSRHGSKARLVVAGSLDLFKRDKLLSKHATDILWANQLKGPGHPIVSNGFYGDFQLKDMAAFFFGSVMPTLLTGEELVKDSRLMNEITVHNDFGLILAIMPCPKQQFTKGLELLFRDANEAYRGSLVGIYGDVMNKDVKRLLPEVQSYIRATNTEEILRQPVIILRPGPRDGKVQDSVVVFDLTMGNMEKAYRDILPVPPALKKRRAKSKSKPVAAAQTTKAHTSEPKSGDKTGQSGSTQKGKDETARQDDFQPIEDEPDKPRHSSGERLQVYSTGVETSGDAYQETPEERQAFDSLGDAEQLESQEGEPSITDAEDDEVGKISEKVNILELVTRISPNTYLKTVRPREVATLSQLAPVVVLFYHTPYMAMSRVFRIVVADLAIAYQNQSSKVVFRTMECNQLPRECQRQGVSQLPSVAFMTSQTGASEPTLTKYEGYMDFNSLKNAVDLYIQPAVKQFSKRQQLRDYIVQNYGSEGEVTAVALLDVRHLTEMAEFSKLAIEMKGRLSFVNAAGELLKHLVEQHNARVPTVLLIKPRDLAEQYVMMKYKFSKSNIKKFLEIRMPHAMGPVTPLNAGLFAHEGKWLFIYFGQTDTGSTGTKEGKRKPHWQRLLSAMKAVALHVDKLPYGFRFRFLWMPEGTRGLSAIHRVLAIENSDSEATAVVINRQAEAYFKFAGTPSQEEIRQFLSDLDSSMYPPSGHLRSVPWSPKYKAINFLNREKTKPHWKGSAPLDVGQEDALSNVTAYQGRLKVQALSDQETAVPDEIVEKTDFAGAISASPSHVKPSKSKLKEHEEL